MTTKRKPVKRTVKTKHPLVTPSGRGLGRRRDRPDPRDFRFSAVHAAAIAVPLPPSVDLSEQLPPCYDQGEEGSCGANSGTALMTFLQNKARQEVTTYSRQMLYWLIRQRIEHTGNEDAGVETRDVLRAMTTFGVVPEIEWPYDGYHFKATPPAQLLAEAKNTVLDTYSRLVQDSSILGCLAQGFPFVLGIDCFESIDSDQLANTGVMPMPDPSEKEIGGHDILCVGYDQHFRDSDVFKKSGVDHDRFGDDRALLIRNSWGTDWGIKGHFWMPMNYATNPSTGGDMWTGRLAA